jgi:hypothetical protein
MRLYAAHIVAAALLIAVFPLAAQTSPNSAQTPPQSNVRSHREPPRPTNLQVLPKDISGKDLIATMHGYEHALGVECSFCHAENPQTHRLDFASDANPHKNTARIMIRMVNEINPKYLATADPDAAAQETRVTCGTCHRGYSHPPAFVAPSREEHGHPSSD